MILKPLQRIQVLESTKKFKPGSLGYFVAQDSVNSYNGWDMCIVFTRFGKKGKNRIEPASVRTYMIDYNTMKDSDREIIDITKLHEGIEPTQYPDRRGRISGALDEIKIEPFPIESKNLLDLPDNEFTAYIIALSMFIHKMTYNKRAYHLTAMPGIRQRDFVASDFNLSIAEPGSIGYYILNGIYYDECTKKKQMPNRKSFRNLYAAQILTQSRKRQLLNRLHRGLAMAKEPIKAYKINTESAFISNSVRINHVLKYYRKHKKELKQIEEPKGKQNSWIIKALDERSELKYERPAAEVEVARAEVKVAIAADTKRARWRA
jgi:hypothetical protein